ncbi:MAG: hypothetical protein EZS28_028628 [Streblomastix strix]|uniref:ATP-dependent DNA helicase n=1 Tax=Streblomastix strix TaxID=222440 RepID=A0A5J4UYT1_9EUKA|nr:MAG: hypothetical protein EZS28_028628 [Streblomastix strix]
MGEAPMASKWALKVVDLILRQLHEKEQLQFGGTIMALGGDFRQVLPVVIGGGRYAEFNNSIKQSELSPHCHIESVLMVAYFLALGVP